MTQLTHSPIDQLTGLSSSRSSFLPFALPDTDETEVDEVAATIRSGWLTTGAKTRQFEAEFALFLGARHAVAVNSCTAAMHLALEALGLQPGDLVVTTPLTFAATAEVVRYFGATPLFVDVDPVTLNLDPACLAEVCADLAQGGPAAQRRLPRLLPSLTSHLPSLTSQLPSRTPAPILPWGSHLSTLTSRPKAILPVHLAGLACDMGAIEAVARDHDLVIVEDAAHALPTRHHSRLIGASRLTPGAGSAAPTNYQLPITSYRSFTCFSFYATKTLTTGEGGMIVTDSDAWAERCRVMSLHGISHDAWKRYTAEGSWYYEILAPGFKYNLTDIAAAMGLAQLRKVDRMWARRQEIARRYSAAFAQMPELQAPASAPPDGQHAWQLYMLRLHLDRLRIDRARFIEELRARNIGTSVHFIPLHLHPYYRETYGYQPDDFPVAHREYWRLISLPIYSRMSDQDVQDVIDAVADIVERNRA
jgi:perosamine synthetase